MNNKLELTWYGKEKEIKVEPRILIEDKTKSYARHPESLFDDGIYDNILIHGDNLLALKALESKFANKVKCIYIDPPYNTGSAFEHYDDNLEHSTWLSLMLPRLKLLKNLLSEDGAIFIQIDDMESAYLKVLCDEVFGRQNYLNTITVKMKNIAGASGGGEDKRLKKNVEFILVYTKKYNEFKWLKNAYSYTELYELIQSYKANGISWKYTSVLYDKGEEKYLCSTVDGDGNEIKIYDRQNYKILSIYQVAKIENISEKQAYYRYIDSIFTTAMPQSSIRPRVIEKLNGVSHSDLISIRYTPRSGKNKGNEYEQFYKGDKFRLLTWLKDVAEKRNDEWCKKDLQGTFWDGFNLNNLTKEGGIEFPNGKKPEALISRIIDMSTKEGDIVLDSFLGSGTTTAVAHKMHRRWIGVEMGNQAYTHCKIRLDKIIDGFDLGGVTNDVNWKNGGGYKFYELAPTLIKTDSFGQPIINKEYSPEMLAAAVAKHEGYKYCPDASCYWKQSKSEENSYLYVTTQHINEDAIQNILNDMQDNEFLLIVCKSFDSNVLSDLDKKLSIKKIPQSLLKNCEFGVDNYNLNIICPPDYDEEDEDNE
jgi:hypothetical protein